MSKLRSSLPCEFTLIAHGTNSIQVGEGGRRKKAPAAAFPLHGKSPENETEARESAETPRSSESSNLYAHGRRIIE